MLETIGSGPLMVPWLGVWDLAWASPEAGLILVAILISLTIAGTVLAGIGGQRGSHGAQLAVVARRPVHLPHPRQHRG